MKKVLLLLAVLPMFVLMACSDDKDDEAEQDLKYIQVRVTSEDTPTPNGNVYLFKVGGYDIKSDKPNRTIDYTPVLSYKYNGEEHIMVPISRYGSKSKGDLLLKEEEGCSVESIYWFDLSSRYGAPKAGDEYLVFVDLRNGAYARSSKRFTIIKNSTITVKLSTPKDESQFVDGEWSIEDYKSK